MDEQIFRDGEWLGDLHEKACLRVYLVHSTGLYHHGIFVHSRHEAMRIVVEYGLQLARVFVTYRDEVILDLVDGMLEFPMDAAPLLNSYQERFPEWEDPFDGSLYVTDWLFDTCRELKTLTLSYIQDSGFDGTVPDDYDHPINRLDRALLTVAADGDFNLDRFGYQDPGVVAANRQRFDRTPQVNHVPEIRRRRGFLARFFS